MPQTLIQFYNHEIITNAPDEYFKFDIAPAKILQAWQSSLFACEILDKDGSIKPESDMQEATLKRYLDMKDQFKRGEALPSPIVGVGLMDGIEIGVGREIIALCHLKNIQTIPVFARLSQKDDVSKLLKI